MNKLISLYIVFVFLILLFIFDIHFFPAWISHIPFTLFFHRLLEVIITVIFILIFLKTNKLYSQTGDKRMVIIAGSFLAASFLNVIYLIYVKNFPYDVLFVENLKQQPALIYLLIKQLIVSISIFIAVFFILKPSEKKRTNFRSIIYFMYLGMVLAAVILDKLILPLLSGSVLYRVLLFEQGLNIIDISLCFLTALILADRRVVDNKNIFSDFIIGLLILGVGKLFIINSQIISLEGILGHFLRIIGSIFIFFGIKEFQLAPIIRTIRQKLLTWLVLFLIMTYVIFSSFISVIFGINLPVNFTYIFIEFLLISAILEYIVVAKLTLPISNISEVINKYMPEEKPEKIKIIQDDEIGILADRLNNILEAEWSYKEELSENKTKFQQIAENEKLLFKITETIRSSLDIDETLTIICAEAAKLFNVERVAVVEYPDKENYENNVIRKQYKIRESIKSPSEIEDFKKIGEFAAKQVLQTGNPLVIDNIAESNQPEFFKNLYKTLEVKSLLWFPIMQENQLWGFITLSKIDGYKHWTTEEIEFLESIADQIYIAIIQAELYEKMQKQVEREKLLREIISLTRSSLDLNKTMKVICEELRKMFKCQRITLNQFLNPKDYTTELITRSESKSEERVVGVAEIDVNRGVSEYWGNYILGQNKNMVINNVEESDAPEDFKKTCSNLLGIKSIIGLPIQSGDDKWGTLALVQTESYRTWTTEEIEFLESIADQIYIAINQAELYEKTQKQVEKESLLRKIIETIRSFPDINETKKSFVTEIGKALNADRTFLVSFDPETNMPGVLDEYSEYLSSPEEVSYVGFDFGSPEVAFFTDVHQRTETTVANDVLKYIKDNNLEGTAIGKWLLKGRMKTGFGMPIFYGKNIYGVLDVHYTKEKVPITDEKLDFIRTLGNQLGIALYQANLLERVKKRAERESFLRKIVETIRSTLDINEIKKNLVTMAGKALNADRVFLVPYDTETNTPGILDEDSEYLSSPDEISCVGFDFSRPEVEFFSNIHKQTKPVIVHDAEGYIKKHNLQDTPAGQWISNMQLKTGLGLVVFYGNKIYGVLGVHYTKAIVNITDEQMEFIKALADQAGIAFYQIELYEKTQKQSERERVLRDIISTLGGTLDINKIKRTLVDEIGKYYQADRCILVEYDEFTGEPLIIDENSFYLGSPQTSSVLGTDYSKEPFREMTLRLRDEKQSVYFTDVDKFLKEVPDSNPKMIEHYKKYNVKAVYAIPIVYLDKGIGVLILNYDHKIDYLDQSDVDFFNAATSQAGVTIYQARLYNAIKKQVEKERTLAEIIKEIKISQSPDEVYKYITTKIADIYNDIDRSFFIQIPENEKPTIKYEYCKTPETIYIDVSELPEKCFINLLEKSNKEGIAIISNTAEHYKDDEEIQNFFKTFNIKSVLVVPLIRYNNDIRLLGNIMLCSNIVKEWNPNEINFIKSIINSTVIILWEIKKRTELEELRNVFILTLTHDLQVPLVGEHKALEFISSRPTDQPIGNFQEIIIEMLQSNENLTIVLKKLLDSYSYELGKQELNLSAQNLILPIDEVIDSFKKLADSKQIFIETQMEENLPLAFIDQEEIKKVLDAILENSILYIQEGGHIIIKSFKQKDKIVTCIRDNGPGIPYKMRERIFERYAMTISVERKIGAGLGLYLAKQIVEAHNGKIWYETETGKGTTFCFTLPFE